MPIFFYDGTPGSGKTYEAVCTIIDNLKRSKVVDRQKVPDPRVVYTNIDGIFGPKQLVNIAARAGLTVEAVRQFLRPIPPKDVATFWRFVEVGALIVIDEAQKYWNAKDSIGGKDGRKEINREFSDWGDEHRHDGYDVILLTPAMHKVDSGVRALCEWLYSFRKMNMFGSLLEKKYRCRIYYGSSPDGQHVNQWVRSYDRKIFACYSSYFADDTKEKKVVAGGNLLKHPIFFAIPLCVGLTIFFLSRSPMAHGDLLGAKELSAKSKAAGTHAPQPLQGQGQGAAASPSVTSSPSVLVVIGYLNGKPIIKDTRTGKITLPARVAKAGG